MDPSASLDHFSQRRDLLRSFLDEYTLLSQEHPELTKFMSFDGFVHFSFAYFRIGEQTGGVLRLGEVLKEVNRKLPT